MSDGRSKNQLAEDLDVLRGEVRYERSRVDEALDLLRAERDDRRAERADLTRRLQEAEQMALTQEMRALSAERIARTYGADIDSAPMSEAARQRLEKKP